MSLERLPELGWTTGRSRGGLRALLITALLGAAVVVLMHWKHDFDVQREELVRRMERTAQLTVQRGERRPRPATQLSSAGARQVNAQIALLNRDWTGLLERLVPRSRQVKLLGMDVNPVTGVLRITGGANSTADANAYAESLQDRDVLLRDVRLMQLEHKPGHVQFEVTAQWAE